MRLTPRREAAAETGSPGGTWAEVRDPAATSRRVTAFAALVSTLVGVVLVVVVQVVLEMTTANSLDEVLQAKARTATDLLAEAGPAAPTLDAGVVVYDREGRRVAGDPPAELASAYADLATAGRETTRGVADEFRVLARPYAEGARSGVVVVSEPTGAYERIETGALWASVAAALTIVVLATAVAAWAGRRALAPVAAMAATAREWGAHDLGRRFDLGPPSNEMRALGRTLDDLLERVQSVILAEQRLTAELAHELRTPLTVVAATADHLASRPGLTDEDRADVEAVRQGCRDMTATVAGLLDLARADARGGSAASTAGRLDLDVLLRGLAERHTGSSRIAVQAPPGVRVGAPDPAVERTLAPLIDNAVRWGEQVVVTAEVEGREVRVLVRDDGPGFDGVAAASAFDPGWSGDGGTGLGLPLARRVARSVGGDVTVRPVPVGAIGDGTQGALPGGCVEVRLPLAPR